MLQYINIVNFIILSKRTINELLASQGTCYPLNHQFHLKIAPKSSTSPVPCRYCLYFLTRKTNISLQYFPVYCLILELIVLTSRKMDRINCSNHLFCPLKLIIFVFFFFFFVKLAGVSISLIAEVFFEPNEGYCFVIIHNLTQKIRYEHLWMVSKHDFFLKIA